MLKLRNRTIIPLDAPLLVNRSDQARRPKELDGEGLGVLPIRPAAVVKGRCLETKNNGHCTPMRRIRKGLDLPIKGSPRQKVDDARHVSRVALVGDDYVGMKPQMAVQEGDSVKLGQVLFYDKTTPGVQYTSPGCGKVVGIHRGAKRRFQSIEIELAGDEQLKFQSYADQSFLHLSREQVRDNLVQSGLWTTPFERVHSAECPSLDSTPHSIFVQAIDTNPLAPSPDTIIEENDADFQRGLQLVSRD